MRCYIDTARADESDSLSGGAVLTVSPAGVAGWSYTNLHGDVVAAADNSGVRTWLGLVGPYGEVGLSYQPNNTAMPGADWGYLGGPGRLTDGPVTLMGARAYEAGLGRFTTVDPIEGGCANDYTYVNGDPINNTDLNGTGTCLLGHNPNGSCRGSGVAKKILCVGKQLNPLGISPPTVSGAEFSAGGGMASAGFVIAGQERPPVVLRLSLLSEAAGRLLWLAS